MSTEKDEKIITSLALALVENPRASLQELAKAIGISKATLYRFGGTREQLVEKITNYGISQINESVNSIDFNTAHPLEAIRKLTADHLQNPEISIFLVHYWECDWETELVDEWHAKMDLLFLRGQQQGLFRIDFPAAALTELWTSILTGMIEAAHRGRIAKAGMLDLIEKSLLEGASA